MSSYNLYFVFLILKLSSTLDISLCLPCDAIDRKYSCNCILQPNNRTVLFENEEQYNVSTDNFLPAIKTLHYCQGSFICKPNFRPVPPSESINTKSFLICLKDDSCLFNGATEPISLRGVIDPCSSSSCKHLRDLSEYTITNDVLQVGTYTCIKVGHGQVLIPPYCLRAACRSFVATEKLCVCHNQSRNCTCSSYCEHLLTSPSHKTYAIFLSFADIYITTGAKGSYFHWVVVTVLSIGLTFLLLIFCKLCEKAMDPSACNQPQNTEALRRMLASSLEANGPSTSTTAKSSITVEDHANRGSPPPTYEQVLKDKCIEFKKSVA